MRLFIGWLFLTLLGQCTPKAEHPNPLPGRPVPTAWIEQLRHYQYQKDNLAILKGFEDIIGPDTLAGSPGVTSAAPKPDGQVGFMFANLDADPAAELIGVFGYYPEHLMLAVFKEIDHSWRLLYTEPFQIHGGPVDMQVGNTFSVHKPFCIRTALGWGSGFYSGQYWFYKLIDNTVHPCLHLVDRSYDEGWEMSREVSTKLQFSATGTDELWVTYAYRFAPTQRLLPHSTLTELRTTALVEDAQGIVYHWNEATRSYTPDIPATEPETGAMRDSTELDAAKLAYLADTGSDSLFIRAFGYELRQLRHEGSPQQKVLLQKYLKAIRQTDEERHRAQAN